MRSDHPKSNLDTKHVSTSPPSFKEMEEKFKHDAKQLSLSHVQTAEEIKRAEAKIAEGIKRLYRLPKMQNLGFDLQGISTVEFTPAELKEVADLFPNALQNGLTVHVFSKDSKKFQLPPIDYMLRQKIKSLCDAALKKFPHIAPALTVNLQNRIFPQLQEVLRRTAEQKLQEIYQQEKIQKFDKKAQGFKQEHNEEDYQDDVNQAFEQATRDVMEKVCEYTFKELYKLQLDYNPDAKFDDFCKAVIKESVHLPSNSQDTLTFKYNPDTEVAGGKSIPSTNYFSYSEGSKTTSHDRGLNRPCANLGLCVDGVFSPETKESTAEFRVTSSIVKHSSLPPIDVLKKANETDLVIETIYHAKAVMERMAKFRLHGRDEKQKDQPMTIDWFYLLLTTNFLNQEGQKHAYKILLKALPFIDGMHFKTGNTVVTGYMSVFNAGINTQKELERWVNKIMSDETDEMQTTENRRAYLRLSSATADLASQLSVKNTPLDKIYEGTEVKQNIQSLYRMLLPASLENTFDQKDLEAYYNKQRHLRQFQDEFVKESNKFYKVTSNLQSEKTAFFQKINDQKEKSPQDKTKALEKAKELFEKAERKNTELFRHIAKEYFKRGTDLRAEESVLTQKLEKARLDYLTSHEDRIKTSVEMISAFFQKPETKEKLEKLLSTEPASEAEKRSLEQATDQLRAITALIYKYQLDQLYKNQDFQKPKFGAAFNIQLAACGRLIGMLTSVSCKSGNDRTFIIRSLYAALEARANNNPIPFSDIENQRFVSHYKENIVSHSAMTTCINDTGGGTPKINIGWFKKLVPFAGAIKSFGDYAAHMMKKIPSWLQNIFNRGKEFFQKQNAEAKQKAKATPAKAGMFAEKKEKEPTPPAAPALSATPAAAADDKKELNPFQSDPHWERKI